MIGPEEIDWLPVLIYRMFVPEEIAWLLNFRIFVPEESAWLFNFRMCVPEEIAWLLIFRMFWQRRLPGYGFLWSR
jgi:hypothetical protein